MAGIAPLLWKLITPTQGATVMSIRRVLLTGLGLLAFMLAGSPARAGDHPRTSTSASSCLNGCTGTWAHANLKDANTGTPWSSVLAAGPETTEWFEIGFDAVRSTDYLRLVPRIFSGRPQCVPEIVRISYWTGSAWQVIRQAELPMTMTSAGHTITFSKVSTSKLRVESIRLRPDDYGGYYFQMAEAYGGESGKPVRQVSEILGRGLVCLPKDGRVYCGWRLLPWDTTNKIKGFNLYRSTAVSGTYTKVNSNAVASSTNYYDSGAVTGTTYYYKVTAIKSDGIEDVASPVSKVRAGGTDNSITIPLISASDTVSKVVVGDLNGDGILDFVVLTPYTGECPVTEYEIDAYVSGNGTWAWSWGKNTGFAPDGDCNHTSIMPLAVWDLDGDKKAEVISRWGVDGSQLAVLRGTDGARLATSSWPVYDGAADRQQLVIAHMADATGDGKLDPYIVVQVGLYVGMQRFVAYQYKSGGLYIKLDRSFDDDAIGRGSHGLPAADVDNDGRDEVIPCGTLLDNDFTLLGMPNTCHNDACFPADIRPDIAGLEIFMGPESCTRKALLTGGTGTALWGHDAASGYKDGWERGWCAELSTAYPGLECYSFETNETTDVGNVHVFTASGSVVTGSFMASDAFTSWPMDWVGGDGVKEVYSFCNAPGVYGCSWYTGWPGDIFGDAREESVVFDQPGSVRIFTNLDVNASRAVTPLADRGYRASLARVGVGYNTNWIPAKSNQSRDDCVAK